MEAGALMAFVGVSNLDRAAEFYGGTLGLELTDERPFALSARVRGTMLRITAVGQMVAVPYTVLGWEVADIAAAVDELSAAGIEFTRYDGLSQDARGVWTAPGGAQVAWFPDPDHNTLSLTQLP